MVLAMTENTHMKVWEEAGWSIVPVNVAVLEVSPPTLEVSLKEVGPESWSMGTGYQVIQFTPRRPIDSERHRVLLDQSLEEYPEIWNILAER